MKTTYLYLPIVILSLALFSCSSSDIEDLPPVEDRVKVAKDSLIDILAAPTYGWKLNYQPNPQSGTFVILMKFDKDGNVNVKSDVSDDDEAYLDNDLTYRIDNAHGLELVLETYGIFHYFFERFNGEFEFVLLNYQDGNPVFRSKSDFNNQTVINFLPAAENDEALLTNEINKQLKRSAFQDASLIGNNAFYQLYLVDKNISIFMTLDLDLRTMKVLNAGVGETPEDISNTNNTVDIQHKTAFVIEGEKIKLDQAFNFSLNGNDILISEFELINFQEFEDSFCAGEQLTMGKFDGKIGNETIRFTGTLYSARTTFLPISDSPYSVGSVGFFDDQDETIQPLIQETFPDAAAIQLYFNYTQIDPPLYGLGFVLVDNNNQVDFFLREFNPPSFEGNKMNVTFTGETLITREPTAAELQGLDNLTDLIFGDGEVYILEFAGDDTLYELYNACNNYKLFLFE